MNTYLQTNSQRFVEYIKYSLLIFIWLAFFFTAIILLDPDFGWHLKMGQLILASGIPKTDPFSYSMPSYSFVDHEWLSGVIFSLLYPTTQNILFGIIYASLAFFALLLVISRQSCINISILLLSAGVLLAFSGIRPQVVSWFFFSLSLKIMIDERLWNRFKFILPVIFLIWANLHGAYAMGLLAFLGWALFNILRNKQVNFLDILILALSMAATLINPYGLNLWKEIWITISSPFQRSTINEWAPIILRINIATFVLASLSTFLIIKFFRKLNLYLVFLFFLLLIMMLISQRHAPFWTILALGLTIECINIWKIKVSKIKSGTKRLNILGKTFFIICLLLFIFQAYYTLKDAQFYSEEKFYPKLAVSFLKTHQISGNLFSPYNWGGYLIWKLPEAQVFIDGRMPTWNQINPPLNEEANAYKKYLDIVYDKGGFQKLAQKYQIQTVLWFKPSVKSPQSLGSIILQKLQKLFNQPVNNFDEDYFIKHLPAERWKLVYQDQIAIIFEKN